MVRKWAAAGAVVLAAGAATGAGAATTPKPCTFGQLKTTSSAVQAGLGHRAIVLRFKNRGATCTLHGYPGADVLSAKHKRLTSAKRTRSGYFGGLKPGEKLPTVRLAKGQTASALMEWTAGSGINPACVRGRYLLVTPPNTAKSVRFAPPILKTEQTCQVQVHPVVRGTTGEG